MSNYLATDTDLTAVADAIRTKGGTSAQLAFPADFVQAIEDIETGGGSAETLLGSGSYTVTSVTSSATISTGVTNTDDTKMIKVLAVERELTSGVAQMQAWANIYPRGPETLTEKMGVGYAKGRYYDSNGTTYYYCNYAQGSTTSAICSFTSSTGSLLLRQYNSSYRIRPGVYDWYVWGVATA